jgi:hypothetical protein
MPNQHRGARRLSTQASWASTGGNGEVTPPDSGLKIDSVASALTTVPARSHDRDPDRRGT